MLIAFAFALGVAEAWMRRQEAATNLWLPWDEPGRRFALRPDGKSINSEGFNERELPLEKPPGVWRVVVVGDSVTFGGGLAQSETYPRVAENILRERGINAEIINCSIYGYDAEQVAATLRYRGWRYEPDLVVYAAYTNDGDPTHFLWLGKTDTPIFVGDPESAAMAILQRNSALFRRFFGAVVARRELNRRYTDDAMRAYLDGAVVKMAEDSRAHGVPLLVWGLVAHVLADPNPDTCGQTRGGGTFCADQLHTLGLIGEVAASHGLPFAHILPALRGGLERSFFLPGLDDPHHPNVDGNARIGALFAEVILAWREGQLSHLEASQVPDIPNRSSAPPTDRPRKGLRPPKKSRGAPPLQNDAPSRDP